MDDIEDYYVNNLGYEKVEGKDGRHILKKGDEVINLDANGKGGSNRTTKVNINGEDVHTKVISDE
jgi:hypothetical protein